MGWPFGGHVHVHPEAHDTQTLTPQVHCVLPKGTQLPQTSVYPVVQVDILPIALEIKSILESFLLIEQYKFLLL